MCGLTLGTLAFSWRLLKYLCCTCRHQPSRLTSEQLGQQAELLAARFFMRRGYSVLGQRESLESAELDLILVDHLHGDAELIVVEVKASRYASGLPHRRFTSRKQERVWLAATEFVRLHQLEKSKCRLELLTVVWGERGLVPTVRRFRFR